MLAELLLRPDETFHVRELERMTGVPAGSLHRELKALYEAGLLVRSRQGNQVRYGANRACPIHEELATIFRKMAGLRDVLREALLPLARQINAAVVFGSLAAGDQQSGSDVDILVIGRVSLLDVVNALDAIADVERIYRRGLIYPRSASRCRPPVGWRGT